MTQKQLHVKIDDQIDQSITNLLTMFLKKHGVETTKQHMVKLILAEGLSLLEKKLG